MDKLPEDYMHTLAFTEAVNREELLIRKCREYHGLLKDKKLKDMVKGFEKECQEHIKVLKDKMIKLNVQVKL